MRRARGLEPSAAPRRRLEAVAQSEDREDLLVGRGGAAVYSLTDSWALTGVLGYRRSIGELGATATDEQFFSVFGLGYRF